MKEIVTEKTIKEITYIGNCPICGKEQKDEWKFKVDVECKDCKDNRYLDAINYLSELGIEVDYNERRHTIDGINFKFKDVEYNMVPGEHEIELFD